MDSPPSPDAAPIEAADGGADVDAAPCVDCEYFPETCSAEVLCPNGPFDGNAKLDRRTQVNVIRGTSATDIWVAGALGALAHYDGTSWTVSAADTQETMSALWLRDSSQVSLSRFDKVYTRGLDFSATDAGGGGPVSPGGWSTHPIVGGDGAQLRSGWSVPGAKWFWCTSLSGVRRMSLSPSISFEGAGFGGGQLESIHGIDANSLWAVGSHGSAIHVTGADGDNPVTEAFNTQTWQSLRGVWVAAESDVWAVGAAGTMRRYRGQGMVWDAFDEVPTTEDLNAVWGTSPSDVWAVGDAGVVLHYDGNRWSRVSIAGLGARRPKLTTVWTSSAGHVWVGGQGVVLSLGGKP
ncbi:hypothetical protein AKJ09_09103 [Labilithrix luteola]|uniref:Type IV fimbrial biogenesis protein PilY1 n=1 Tax=Labilithrix luteola TaxID=1391654 RepID=A0A0K1QAJ2_9BACT|nr:hypothetical protein AKJ09_09103 [Labilithrix luteola]